MKTLVFLTIALLLSGCYSQFYGLRPINLGAGEGGLAQYASEDVSRVKSPLSGAPN